MDLRSFLNGLRVTVELGDMLPGYEFDALRVMKELEEEEKSKFPIVKAAWKPGLNRPYELFKLIKCLF